MAPTGHDIAVATEALRTEAEVWRAQSTATGAVAATVRALNFSRVEAGVFQIVVAAHTGLVAHIAARCTEGSVEVTQIADTLHAVADTYDAEEHRNEHAPRNLY